MEAGSKQEKEREKEKDKDREREKEADMEAALYTNCLLLGIDTCIFGQGGGMPRPGLFRHSNPRMGEALLHFLLSALRGPAQSSKDFAGVWPIFDAAQSRDFRKIVQNLINELEAQGALPRSNSRVSSLATCCGQRFVELLWQLSAHALREVHKRSFPSDVASNPLPASLTEVVAQSSHAAALLPVTKARIAVERRRFLEGAAAAVRRQELWSNLAHDMTAEYRGLCAEEAYLNQELEKLNQLKKAKESFNGQIQVNSSDLSTNLKRSVTQASVAWDSLLKHMAQHEKLASGPIEDLIAHREHRYRVSGTTLRAAIEKGSVAGPNDASIFQANDSSNGNPKSDAVISELEVNGDASTLGVDDGRERAGKGTAPLDVAEILRRWTHALQRLHKQAVRMARSNDGAGPELMKDNGENGHEQALRSTLAEHRQHLSNIQVLVAQLNESIPAMETSISSLRDHVNKTNPTLASSMPSGLSPSPHSDKVKTPKEASANHLVDGMLNTLSPHLELIPPTPALKLPQIFSASHMPSSVRAYPSQKPHSSVPKMGSLDAAKQEGENLKGQKMISKASKDDVGDGLQLSLLRQQVRDAALSGSGQNISDNSSENPTEGAEHFFTPIVSSSLFPKLGGNVNKQNSGSMVGAAAAPSQEPTRGGGNKPLTDSSSSSSSRAWKDKGSPPNAMIKQDSSTERNRPFSPPLLTDFSSFGESFDDLLAPMSDMDVALMDCSMQTLHA